MTQNTYFHNVNLLPARCIYMQIHRTAHSESAPAPHTDYKCTVHSCRYPQTHVVHRWPSSCSSANSIPPHPHPTHAHAHARSLSLSHTHTHTRGGDGSMSHWSGAQSFWQQHKVSQQVTAGCLSAREGVTSHRETTSLICHFRSVSQRKCRREGETDMERKKDRQRESEGFEVHHSMIRADETTVGQTERCWPCGWVILSPLCVSLCVCACYFVAANK